MPVYDGEGVGIQPLVGRLNTPEMRSICSRE